MKFGWPEHTVCAGFGLLSQGWVLGLGCRCLLQEACSVWWGLEAREGRRVVFVWYTWVSSVEVSNSRKKLWIFRHGCGTQLFLSCHLYSGLVLKRVMQVNSCKHSGFKLIFATFLADDWQFNQIMTGVFCKHPCKAPHSFLMPCGFPDTAVLPVPCCCLILVHCPLLCSPAEEPHVPVLISGRECLPAGWAQCCLPSSQEVTP